MEEIEKLLDSNFKNKFNADNFATGYEVALKKLYLKGQIFSDYNYRNILNKYPEFFKSINLINNKVENCDEKYKEFINSENAFFHYTSLENAILILESKTLRYSYISNFADPYESLKNDFSIVFKSGSDLNSKELDNLKKYIKKRQQLLQVLCFSTNNQILEGLDILRFHYALEYINKEILNLNFKILSINFKNELIGDLLPNPGYDKFRMWELYANKYKGICLVLDKRKIKFRKNTKNTLSGQVNYVKNFESVSGNLNLTNEDNFKNSIQSYFKKHFDYRDENEYRILIDSKKQESLDISKSLSGIIIGCKANYKLIQDTIFNLRNKNFNKEVKVIEHVFTETNDNNFYHCKESEGFL